MTDLELLKSDPDELFRRLIDLLLSGQTLTDAQVAMMAYLKKRAGLEE